MTDRYVDAHLRHTAGRVHISASRRRITGEQSSFTLGLPHLPLEVWAKVFYYLRPDAADAIAVMDMDDFDSESQKAVICHKQPIIN